MMYTYCYLIADWGELAWSQIEENSPGRRNMSKSGGGAIAPCKSMGVIEV